MSSGVPKKQSCHMAAQGSQPEHRSTRNPSPLSTSLARIPNSHHSQRKVPSLGHHIFLINPARAGTAPGTFASETNDIRPNIANRPLLISIFNFLAFCSSESFFVNPKGSKRFNGTGCGISLNVGKYPGLPPLM